MKKQILVVEDDEDILELVKFNLERNGFNVATSTNGEESLRKALLVKPDLIVLDLMLPGIDGLEVCRHLKGDTRTSNIPIVMLTAKTEEIDMVTGLELGADDYIPKPFSPRVLIARIKAVLRRKARKTDSEETPLVVHEIEINPGRHEVRIKGKVIELTVTEFRILQTLAKRPGWVFSRQQIIDASKGEDYAVTDRAVDVQIVGLRKKLGKYGDYIETVRGVGYKFKE